MSHTRGVNPARPPIETERLILRTPIETDLDDILAYRNHPDRDPSEPALDPDAALALIETQHTLDPDALPAGGAWIMSALELHADGRVVGEAGVFLSPPAQSFGNLGWWLHPAHRHRGLATEAARAILDHLFVSGKVHRVTANCHPDNHASRRVMQRLGMRHEGTSRESRRVGDAWHDELAYALLRSEWHPAR